MTRYRDSLERSGWALALGAGAVGVGTVLVGWGSGAAGPGQLAAYGVIGGVLGACAIVALGGPAWWLVQRRGRRGPVAAGLTGAAVAGGLGLLVMTLTAGAVPSTALWASAGATAAIAGFIGGLIALAMWLVRYRAG